MNNPTEDYTPDIEQDTREWLPLDTARNTFTGLVTGPDPLAIDGCDFPGLPARPLPLDDLRDRLLDRACPLHIRDAVWRHLIQRARDEGATWMLACVGVALPGLAGTARWLAARYRGDRGDVHAAVLSGFVEALASVDLSDPGAAVSPAMGRAAGRPSGVGRVVGRSRALGDGVRVPRAAYPLRPPGSGPGPCRRRRGLDADRGGSDLGDPSRGRVGHRVGACPRAVRARGGQGPRARRAPTVRLPHRPRPAH